MESKGLGSLLERGFKKRFFPNTPSTSYVSDSSLSKLQSFSNTPKLAKNSVNSLSFLSRLEKNIMKVCGEPNGEYKLNNEKNGMFLTEINERIDYLKAHPPAPLPLIDGVPVKMKKIPGKKGELPLTPKLSFVNRKRNSKEDTDTVENLLKSTSHFYDRSKEELLSQLQKSLSNIKSPCIQDLYAKITRNERSFKTYKKITQINEIDPFIAFNQVCNNEHIPPIPLLSKIQDNSLILNRYRINDVISAALSDAFSIMPYLTILHLDENALTDLGGFNILKGLIQQGQLSSFFYTSNEIGPKFLSVFKEFVKSCPLTELSFRGCRVNSNILLDLIPYFRYAKGLKKLFFSELGLSNACMEKISRYVRKSLIIELDLSWNQISQDASLRFFKFLKSNKRLTILNYSWNNIGSEESDVCIILNHVLMQHPSLMHINLSHTDLNDSNFLSLAPGLQTSKTLVSVHVTGNKISQKKINTMMIHLVALLRPGFITNSAARVEHPIRGNGLRSNSCAPTIHNIKSRDKSGKSLNFHRDALSNKAHSSSYNDRFERREVKEVIFSRYLGDSTVKESKAWSVSEHCWICERWLPFSINISIGSLEKIGNTSEFKWLSQLIAPYKLKCSFNLWEDLPLEQIELNKYEYSGILPSGIHRFWVITNNSEINVTRQHLRQRWEGYKVNEISIPSRNYDLEPIEEIKEVNNVFDKNKSVFKNFVEDTEVTRKIMFENDKKHFKLARIIKDEVALNEVNKVLVNNYAVIKEIFDATSARSNYPNIGWLDFSSFCDQCQLIDNKSLNRAAIDRCFIAVNVDFDDLDDNPQQELCRYEFFEIIARMALCKYQDLPLTPAEMTQKLIEEHIFKFSDPSLAIKFRREKLYSYDVNTILEANLLNCQALFKKYKDRLGRWITLEAFKNLIKNSTLNVKDEDIIKIYAFSKMSIIDEMNSADSYDRMLFVEFLESLGRLSNAAYKDSEASLAEMMEMCLEILFRKNGLKIKKAVPEKEEISEDSDN